MLRVLLVGACLLVPALSSGAAAPKEIAIDDPDVVEGRGAGPEGGRVDVPDRADFQCIIQVRADFKDKVVASVSEL